MDELHYVCFLDPVAYSLGEAAEFVSRRCAPLFLVPRISHELAVLEELTCVSVKDRHWLVYFVLDFGDHFGKAAGLSSTAIAIQLGS